MFAFVVYQSSFLAHQDQNTEFQEIIQQQANHFLRN
jgi:hypothetical protein